MGRDARGYPIPFLVLVDSRGRPQFTVNDVRRADLCRRKHLCSICGKRFDPEGAWFVGGSRAFLHPNGVFQDPPMHLDCAEYALRVCPFLAAPRWSRSVADAKLSATTPIEYMPPRLPERFGLGLPGSYHWHPESSVFVVDGWRYVEFWRAGQPIAAPETADPAPDPRIPPPAAPR